MSPKIAFWDNSDCRVSSVPSLATTGLREGRVTRPTRNRQIGLPQPGPMTTMALSPRVMPLHVRRRVSGGIPPSAGCATRWASREGGCASARRPGPPANSNYRNSDDLKSPPGGGLAEGARPAQAGRPSPWVLSCPAGVPAFSFPADRAAPRKWLRFSTPRARGRHGRLLYEPAATASFSEPPLVAAPIANCQVYDKGFDPADLRRANRGLFFGLVSFVRITTRKLDDSLARDRLRRETRSAYSADHAR